MAEVTVLTAQATLDAIADLDDAIQNPYGTDVSVPNALSTRVRPVPAVLDRISFAKAIPNNVDSDWGMLHKLGAGMTVNQTGGNLVITSGTTINSETIIRGNDSFVGGVRLRAKVTISQRIANQSFFVELVDVVGNDLPVTIDSATAVTVTMPAGKFSSVNIGQSMYLGAYAGTGVFIPGRYAISAVNGNAVTFTVAGFTVGAGTTCAFGWSYYHLLYDGVSATATKFDTQRLGWANGDLAITVNTTATGHVVGFTASDTQAGVFDAAVNSTTSNRGNRTENVPDDIPLLVQVRVVNGSVAPASTTSLTVGFIAVDNYAALDATIQDLRMTTSISPLLVNINNSPTVNTTPTVPSTYNLETASTAVVAAAVKASAGSLFELTLTNTTATAVYVKFYNKTTAPAPATDIPVMIIPVPANSFQEIQFGSAGKRFATGIAIGITGAAVKTDTTLIVAGVIINGSYI